MFAEKSWGSFKVIDVETTSLTIKVTLNPGHSMNYHSHKNRDEVWIVISGEGKTIVDGMEQMVKSGDVITMSAGCRHTVIADTELKLIEVQLGADINVHDKQKFELEYWRCSNNHIKFCGRRIGALQGMGVTWGSDPIKKQLS